MTKAQLIADLKAIIGPGNTRDDTMLTTWINGAYMYMADEIAKANPDFYTRAQTADLVSGQQEYTLPTDYEKIVMVNVKADGTWYRALPLNNINSIGIHSRTDSSQGFTASEPCYYIINQTIGIMPIPAASVDEGLKVWYLYTPEYLTLDTDEPDIPKKYHHILKYGAYADYLDQDDSHAEADRMRARFYERVDAMVENLSDNQVDEPRSIQVVDNFDLYMVDE